MWVAREGDQNIDSKVDWGIGHLRIVLLPSCWWFGLGLDAVLFTYCEIFLVVIPVHELEKNRLMIEQLAYWGVCVVQRCYPTARPETSWFLGLWKVLIRHTRNGNRDKNLQTQFAIMSGAFLSLVVDMDILQITTAEILRRLALFPRDRKSVV